MAPITGPPMGVVPISSTVWRASTRPCMRGSARIWTIAVVAVMKAMLLKPTRTTIGNVAPTLGAKARTSEVTPNAAAPRTMLSTPTVRRSATTKAPTRAPALNTV